MARATATRADRAGRLTEAAGRAAHLSYSAAEPHRLEIILLLEGGEQYVGELSEALGRSEPAVSHHVAMLRHAGIVAPRRDGKYTYYRLTERGRALAAFARRLGV